MAKLPVWAIRSAETPPKHRTANGPYGADKNGLMGLMDVENNTHNSPSISSITNPPSTIRPHCQSAMVDLMDDERVAVVAATPSQQPQRPDQRNSGAINIRGLSLVY